MVWDGKTERRNSPNDHDKITRLLVLSENQTSDIAELKNDFKNHVKDDNTKFNRINWFIAIGVGIISTLEFLFKREH